MIPERFVTVVGASWVLLILIEMGLPPKELWCTLFLLMLNRFCARIVREEFLIFYFVVLVIVVTFSVDILSDVFLISSLSFLPVELLWTTTKSSRSVSDVRPSSCGISSKLSRIGMCQ